MGLPSDTRQMPNYTQSGNVNDYRFNPGVCILPLAEDPPELESDGSNGAEVAAYSPVIVCRLHAPYRVRRFSQLSQKDGNPAPVAAPGDSGKFVFLGGTVTVGNSLGATFSTFNWTVGAEYGYVENCVSRNEDGMVLGSPPYKWLTDDQNINQYGYSPPQIGAVSQAGKDVVVGYRQGATIVDGSGNLNNSWTYNSPAFYPGELFYDGLSNGGRPI